MSSLLSDLSAVGFPAASVSDLRNSGVRYRGAVPVLLRWLPLTVDSVEKQEIVRALSVPWAKPDAVAPLLDQFRAGPVPADARGESLRWAVGNALEVLYDDAEFEAFARLVQDRRYGKARQMVVLGLGKSKRREAVDVLIGLLEDPDVDGHAVKALGKLRAPASRAALQSMVDDKRAWVRKEAQRAVARLG